MVKYRQVINGLPVVTPDAGTLRVTVDNDGTVTDVSSSVRPIDRLVDRLKNTTASPPEPGARSPVEEPIAQARATDVADYKQLLAEEWAKRMATRWVVRGETPLSFTVVPGSTEVSYDIRSNDAIIVARRAIDADFGRGFRARYWVTVPLVE